ncbi:DUF4124 domain-containing protein [Diaphorobacter caeni]|uniref:DUF4124 domain-containing protein n=1 Tax=Diaphorobacter caeni TaxID=2784387 RepID=UPI00188F6DE8|nr:DUF4124 domain-containing protein [Diaphorobacter caeni]MBF5002975.1 DUF4124 domain-containing protein [Diaphorobacter caeni]
MWRASATRIASAAFLLLLHSLPAHAQVYQCTGSNGKVSYSDAPCAQHQTSRTVEEARSAADIQRERAQANEALERRQRDAQSSREQQRLDMQQTHSAAPAPGPRDLASTAQCAQAKKELEFVSSIRTLGEAEQRVRTNAAITTVNAACGTSTPLMQEPTRVIIHQDAQSHPQNPPAR